MAFRFEDVNNFLAYESRMMRLGMGFLLLGRGGCCYLCIELSLFETDLLLQLKISKTFILCDQCKTFMLMIILQLIRLE
jgi:hypothetical protein